MAVRYLKYLRGFLFAFILASATTGLPTVAVTQQDYLSVECAAGRWEGSRAEFIDGRFEDRLDGVSYGKTTYKIDLREGKRSSLFSFGQETEIYPVHVTNWYITVLYSVKGVPYMDTIYTQSGVVYSTLHKWFDVPVANTFHNQCEIR